MFSQVSVCPEGGAGYLWYQVPSGGGHTKGVCPGVSMSRGWVCPRGGNVLFGRYSPPMGVDCMAGVWVVTPSPDTDTWDLGNYGIRSTCGRYASYWNAFLWRHVISIWRFKKIKEISCVVVIWNKTREHSDTFWLEKGIWPFVLHVTYHSVQEVHITSVFHHHMVTGQIAGVVIPKVHLTQTIKTLQLKNFGHYRPLSLTFDECSDSKYIANKYAFQ